MINWAHGIERLSSREDMEFAKVDALRKIAEQLEATNVTLSNTNVTLSKELDAIKKQLINIHLQIQQSK